MGSRHAEVVALFTRVRELQSAARAVTSAPDATAATLRPAFEAARNEAVAARVALIEIDRLAEITGGRLRIDALKRHGYRVVADVLRAQRWQLEAVPGVGERTATQTIAAARQLATTVRERTPFRFDPATRPTSQTRLLDAVLLDEDARRYARELAEPIAWLDRQLAEYAPAAELERRRVRRLFAGRARREVARSAVVALERVVQDPYVVALTAHLAEVTAWLARPNRSVDVWDTFDQRAADVYARLAEFADLDLDVAAAMGNVPAEIAAAVSAQELDTALLRVSLRGYQAFGAKFALVQRRAMLGDEMGLGKTVEAIAAMAHLASVGATHFLVVCPASVLINWTREVRERSELRVTAMHGIDRDAANRAWIDRGGVGVTTFDTLKHVGLPSATRLAMLVVDEAHNVKNPRAQRSRHVRARTDYADRVLFLTGTPLENRVEEFKTLVAYLQPMVADQLNAADAVAGAEVFRRRVAPAYLRRNQTDVLQELPDLIEVDEWVELSGEDTAAYVDAVVAGHFMAMRRAAYAAPAHASAKLVRLCELVEEAAADGLKVVVFSFFRDVLKVVAEAVPAAVFGPLHGGIDPASRQQLVDGFTRHDGPAVLVSQIQAGGTGLNMQAGSVVILTEPQFKPSAEAQAVARCHRMGQTHRVQVHRLLAQPGVDVRLLEILDRKSALFDAYVRDSALAAATPDAVDVSETEAARQIIQLERQRLGLDPDVVAVTEPEQDEWLPA